MTRVNDQRQAERVREQRQTEAKNRQLRQEGREQFSKALAQQKNEAGEARKQQESMAGRSIKQGATHSALLARRGIEGANKFQSMLGQRGQQHIKHTKSQARFKTSDSKETEHTSKATEARVDRQQIDQLDDKLAPISDDAENSGSGGGFADGDDSGDDSNNSSMQGQAGGSPMGLAQQAAATQQAQGANAPQLPPHIVQEIIKRVMVGVDQEGISQFIIQLKDDVLGGATLQISAEHGRIKAKFTTKDENAARLVKASEGQLARALPKGLILESLEVESS